ncbi:hypothetical protein RJT34_02238 [Clitoria ternatea]|uniref:Uncharacterized protein n=1 Tax=Clitoria ternatea TaxID=43366 RepID=A0AAN9KL33_CLITE
MEMIKGIKGHGSYDELVVPIIENTAYEYELTESLAKAIEAYPKTTAVLAECYHYLFDAAIKLQLGLDWSTPNHGSIQNVKSLSIAAESNLSVKARKANGEIDPFPQSIVLDIEGTTSPISFVTKVLFQFARQNVGRHLSLTYDTPETQADIKLLRSQVLCLSIPLDDAGQEVIAALVTNVEAMIKADRKITALKELQGIVFDDVLEALEKWHALGIKVAISFP